MAKVIVDNLTMKRTIRRLSYEIIEKHNDLTDIVIIGIKTKGLRLAEIITDNIFNIEGIKLDYAEIDTTTYRDDVDVLPDATKNKENLTVNLTDKIIILVDDVLYTGRTIRAAMDAIIALGRPKAIELAVLVDRGHRQLPIKANYIGKNIPTSNDELIKVTLTDFGDDNNIVITRKTT